jgi:hypothetical protein
MDIRFWVLLGHQNCFTRAKTIIDATEISHQGYRGYLIDHGHFKSLQPFYGHNSVEAVMDITVIREDTFIANIIIFRAPGTLCGASNCDVCGKP